MGISHTRCLIPLQHEPDIVGSVDRAGRRQLEIPISAQELHLATLKHILKCLLTGSLHSPALAVQGAAGIDLLGVLKGWNWAQHKRKGISVLLYVIN